MPCLRPSGFACLGEVLTQAARAAPVDVFPTRARDGVYSLTPDDFEDLHPILREMINCCYRRVARESGLVHGSTLDPGLAIQTWKPWLAPVCTGSATWKRRNSITLSSAVSAFHVPGSKSPILVCFMEATGGVRLGLRPQSQPPTIHMRSYFHVRLRREARSLDVLAKYCSCFGLNFLSL